MPEITDAELRSFVRYQNIGTVDEIQKKQADLERDNFQGREALRLAKENAPSPGSVILTAEEGAAFVNYSTLGTFEEVTNGLTAGKSASKKVRIMEARDSATKFALASGVHTDAVDTLIGMPALEGATFEVRTKKETNEIGKEVEIQTGYITLSGDGQKAMTFEDAQLKVAGMKGLRQAEVGGPTLKFAQQGSAGSVDDKKKTLFDNIRATAKAKQEKASQAPDPSKSIEARMGMLPTP